MNRSNIKIQLIYFILSPLLFFTSTNVLSQDPIDTSFVRKTIVPLVQHITHSPL